MVLYGQLVYQFARRRGPQDADAADVAQFVFRAISEEIQRRDYSSLRGSFRNWLLVVTQNHVAKHLERRQTSNRAAADGFHEAPLQNCVAEDHEPGWWEREHRCQAFRAARRSRGP